MVMIQPVISVENLTYYYPGKKALENVSFAIDKGSITALVGPNGAGKSTLLRSLAGLDLPFTGKIKVAGVDVLEDPRLAHTKIGYLSDDFGLYSDLTVRDVLLFMGGCHNFSGEALQDRTRLGDADITIDGRACAKMRHLVPWLASTDGNCDGHPASAGSSVAG